MNSKPIKKEESSNLKDVISGILRYKLVLS
jgi:hypothetical protein